MGAVFSNPEGCGVGGAVAVGVGQVVVAYDDERRQADDDHHQCRDLHDLLPPRPVHPDNLCRTILPRGLAPVSPKPSELRGDTDALASITALHPASETFGDYFAIAMEHGISLSPRVPACRHYKIDRSTFRGERCVGARLDCGRARSASHRVGGHRLLTGGGVLTVDDVQISRSPTPSPRVGSLRGLQE